MTSLLNASGCLDALTAPEVARDLDAFVTKTVTPLPREGNPPPRFAELPGGMLNSIGLQNPGIDAFLEDSLPRLGELGVPVWVSVGGFSAADYGLLCGRLEERDDVSVIELNLSCPNVEEAPETAAELVASARAATRKPLYAKLSPATWDVAESARAVAAAGADGLSLINTIRGLALSADRSRPVLGRGAGGYSGPALRPIALACVFACAAVVDLPIVGMGGVSSGADVLDLVAAGATQVALGTVLFADPWAARRIRSELRESGVGVPENRSIARDSVPAAVRTQIRQHKNPCKSGKTVLLDQQGQLGRLVRLMVTTKSHAQAPARSLDQRMEALQRANDVRVRRAQLKRDLKAGREEIESILLDPPGWVETAKVFDMLMAVPKFGRVKAARLLNQCRISQSKTVGGLSERQRTELVELFNHRA